MKTTIINIIFSIISSDTVKTFIVKGLRKLVQSTDNGIDNTLLDVMLSEAVQSSLNDLTEDKVKEIKEKYNIK